MAEAAAPADAFKHVFTHSNQGAVNDFYDTVEELGSGSFGQVFKVRNKKTGVIRALKTMKLGQVKDQEIKIQQQLDHPHIVKLYEVFQDNKKMYLVMELCTGGELFDYIVDTVGVESAEFTEMQACTYMTQIMGAMTYMHSHSFVHRDIKPENFLLQNKERDAPVKVIDFGLATLIKPGQKLKTKAGTPYYVAPEVLKGSYDEKCDIWSCGVIVYILLTGEPPFYGDSDKEILDAVKRGEYSFDGEAWAPPMPELRQAKDLITKMLTMNPATRPTAADVLSHTWFKDHSDKAPGALIQADMATKLRAFTAKNKLEKVCLTVLAKEMKDEDIKDLKAVFTALDANNDGMLTYDELKQGMKNAKIAIPDDIMATLGKIDSDGSGQIDYTEFIAAALDKKLYLKEESLWSAFRVFDIDGDGKISKEELKTITQTSDNAELIEMIRKIDLDGDGEVSFDEFCAMVRSM